MLQPGSDLTSKVFGAPCDKIPDAQGIAVRQERQAAPTSASALAWRPLALGALGALIAPMVSTPAHACGGFFCNRQPVDQSAERILFEVGDSSVTMTTQISFTGKAEDFAWILPLSEVPAVESLALFPQRALLALDTATGPVFNLPNDPACYPPRPPIFARAQTLEARSFAAAPALNVQVLLSAEVGPYGVAVIESDDSQALVDWLRAEDYRITEAMEPYIALYTKEGLKFLALKLKGGADVSDIQPFRFTLPSTTPTIPIRMTALAAEPEMSILTFVLANQRFEGKNWENLSIPDSSIRFWRNQISLSPLLRVPPTAVLTNWASLVAKAVDAADGRGWVTEYAGPSAEFAGAVRSQLNGGFFPNPDDRQAAQELLEALEVHPYLTRLYTRLSPEEMQVDPLLGRSSLGDTSRVHMLSRFVDGEDQCSGGIRPPSPCDFTTCGAGGLCRLSSAGLQLGCACVPGATARVVASSAAAGGSSVLCQDGRLSFMNPGQQESEDSLPFPDPCLEFSCGSHGQCVAMNLTPTCVCDQGYVAVGSLDAGGPVMDCVLPTEAIPEAFYRERLAALPTDLPGGRATEEGFPTPRPAPGLIEPRVAVGAEEVTEGLWNYGGGCALPSALGDRRAWSFAWLLGAIGVGAIRRRSRRLES